MGRKQIGLALGVTCVVVGYCASRSRAAETWGDPKSFPERILSLAVRRDQLMPEDATEEDLRKVAVELSQVMDAIPALINTVKGKRVQARISVVETDASHVYALPDVTVGFPTLPSEQVQDRQLSLYGAVRLQETGTAAKTERLAFPIGSVIPKDVADTLVWNDKLLVDFVVDDAEVYPDTKEERKERRVSPTPLPPHTYCIVKVSDVRFLQAEVSKALLATRTRLWPGPGTPPFLLSLYAGDPKTVTADMSKFSDYASQFRFPGMAIFEVQTGDEWSLDLGAYPLRDNKPKKGYWIGGFRLDGLHIHEVVAGDGGLTFFKIQKSELSPEIRRSLEEFWEKRKEYDDHTDATTRDMKNYHLLIHFTVRVPQSRDVLGGRLRFLLDNYRLGTLEELAEAEKLLGVMDQQSQQYALIQEAEKGRKIAETARRLAEAEKAKQQAAEDSEKERVRGLAILTAKREVEAARAREQSAQAAEVEKKRAAEAAALVEKAHRKKMWILGGVVALGWCLLGVVAWQWYRARRLATMPAQRGRNRLGAPIDALDNAINTFQRGLYGLIPTLLLHGVAAAVIAAAVLYFFGAGWGAGVVAVLVFMDVIFLALQYHRRQRKNPQRGFLVMKESVARSRAAHLLSKYFKNDRGFLWGNLRLPTKALEKSCLIVGNIGSGKTLLCRILMNDQLPLLRPESNRRALIYDSKQDCLQMLAGMERHCPIYILTPFDERHAAWDIAKDIYSSTVADTFAEHIIPKNPKANQPYFENVSRQLLNAVLQVFIEVAPGRWTFRQLLLVMRSIERIEQVVARHVDSRETVEAILKEVGTQGRGNIISSVVAETRKYECIAACWEGAKKKISIRDWMHSTSVLVLGNYEPARSAIERVNAVFMEMVRNYGLSLPDDESRMTWLFMDEFAEAGKFEGFKSLVLRGRSKGFVSVVGLQDVRALHSIYGEDDADTFVEQLGNRAFLHMKSAASAQWASDCINKSLETFEELEDKEKFRDAVPPQTFLNLPEADFHIHGVHGLYQCGMLGVWEARFTPAELQALLPKPETRYRPFVEIAPARTKLQPWSAADAKVFGIPFVPPRRDEEPSPANAPHFEQNGAGIDGVRRFSL